MAKEAGGVSAAQEQELVAQADEEWEHLHPKDSVNSEDDDDWKNVMPY